jgi:4-hydroxybenzoate polyprenyltransferase
MMGGYNLIATSFIFWIHFAQLFLFILILAILFDIKDIERDQDDAVSTIVIRIGKNKLINSIITPILIVYGFAVTLEWKMANLSFTFLGMQMILLVLVYIVSKKVISIYSIFKNILLIDGLMIIKAILSIIVIKW